MLIHGLECQTAALKRCVGLLLVVFVLYGTTVEAAHRHGQMLSPTDATSLVEPEESSSPVSSTKRCSDCLICQLHQSFSTTLVAFRLVDPPLHTLLNATATVAVDVLLQLNGPTAERAPPSIS